MGVSKGLNFTRYSTVPINALDAMLAQCVKGFEFYPISNCADCTNIAPTVVTTS